MTGQSKLWRRDDSRVGGDVTALRGLMQPPRAQRPSRKHPLNRPWASFCLAVEPENRTLALTRPRPCESRTAERRNFGRRASPTVSYLLNSRTMDSSHDPSTRHRDKICRRRYASRGDILITHHSLLLTLAPPTTKKQTFARQRPATSMLDP